MRELITSEMDQVAGGDIPAGCDGGTLSAAAFTGAVGGAMAGASNGAAYGSVGGGIGALAGGLLGALGGAIFGGAIGAAGAAVGCAISIAITESGDYGNGVVYLDDTNPLVEGDQQFSVAGIGDFSAGSMYSIYTDYGNGENC